MKMISQEVGMGDYSHEGGLSSWAALHFFSSSAILQLMGVRHSIGEWFITFSLTLFPYGLLWKMMWLSPCDDLLISTAVRQASKLCGSKKLNVQWWLRQNQILHSWWQPPLCFTRSYQFQWSWRIFRCSQRLVYMSWDLSSNFAEIYPLALLLVSWQFLVTLVKIM